MPAKDMVGLDLIPFHRGPEGGQNPQNELSFMNFNCLFFESAIPGELKTL